MTEDAAREQEEIWDEVGRNLDELFRQRFEEEDDRFSLEELEGISKQIRLVRQEQRPNSRT